MTIGMPTPGTYDYPGGYRAPAPEAFTLRVLVSHDPEDESWRGAFDGAGRVAGRLTLSGHVSRRSQPSAMESLQNAGGAGVHLVAPHGALSPDRLAEHTRVPSGAPGRCWLAHFD